MKVAILGFGREGQSAYEYWHKKGAQLVIHDNNDSVNLPDAAGSVLGKGAFLDLDQYGYDLMVRSPGLRLDIAGIRTPTTTVTNEFLAQCKAKVIGVTGTKGKGTTSTLIYEMLCLAGYKAHLLGNIGSPALDQLDDIAKEDIVVYEMSSFQLYDIKSSPHVAVCLMVSEDHLDWHKDLAEYHASKGNIFKYQKPSDVAVYFKDNQVSSSLAKLSQADTKYSYGLGGDVTFDGDFITAFSQKVIGVEEVALPGPHNLENIAAAICAVWEFSSDTKLMAEIISTFRGLPFHIEEVANKNGVTYYNDSFSTNPSAALAAVNSFEAPIVLFLGGFDKKADFSELSRQLAKRTIRHVVTYGQTGASIKASLNSAGVTDVTYVDSKDFKKIIREGVKKAQSGDVVVFSPACASFDMFSDYKSRGQQFNDIVASLK